MPINFLFILKKYVGERRVNNTKNNIIRPIGIFSDFLNKKKINNQKNTIDNNPIKKICYFFYRIIII